MHDLMSMTRTQAQAIEPPLECVAALLSPSTGNIDSHALMLSLVADLEVAGGVLALNSPLAQAKCVQVAIDLIANDGTHLRTRSVVKAAGLGVYLTLDLTTCKWTRSAARLSMLRFASTGPHWPTALCCPLTPASAPTLAGRGSRRRTFVFRACGITVGLAR